MATAPATVDEYLATLPADSRDILERIRAILHENVPGGEEKIRYGMPAIMLGGRDAIHFAGWKKHVGLYPIPVLDEALERELAPFRSAKDSVTFPYANPVPYELIGRVAAAIVARRRGADH
jgi:uncharacterized protein YdhG (YjbR/CyaY superfamily)